MLNETTQGYFTLPAMQEGETASLEKTRSAPGWPMSRTAAAAGCDPRPYQLEVGSPVPAASPTAELLGGHADVRCRKWRDATVNCRICRASGPGTHSGGIEKIVRRRCRGDQGSNYDGRPTRCRLCSGRHRLYRCGYTALNGKGISMRALHVHRSDRRILFPGGGHSGLQNGRESWVIRPRTMARTASDERMRSARFTTMCCSGVVRL